MESQTGKGEQSIQTQMPTKLEVSEMFEGLEKKLGNSFKTEIASMRADLGHLLKRVEDAEDKNDKQAQEIKELKTQIKNLHINQREVAYKTENQCRRRRGIKGNHEVNI